MGLCPWPCTTSLIEPFQAKASMNDKGEISRCTGVCRSFDSSKLRDIDAVRYHFVMRSASGEYECFSERTATLRLKTKYQKKIQN